MSNVGVTRIYTGTAKSDQIIAAVGDGITVHDQEYRIVYQNETMKALFGDRVGQLCYQAYQNLNEVCVGCPVQVCFASGEVHTVERIVNLGEETLIFETCASPIQDKSGTIVAVVEVVRNATRRKLEEERIARLKDLYDALSRTNKAIMHRDNQDELFAEICQVAVQHGKLSLALIGMLDPVTHQLRPAAHSGAASRYIESLSVSADYNSEAGNGPTGIAIRHGVPYVCNDFHADPATVPWREAALDCGIRSSAVFPLMHDGRVMGAFKVYSDQEGFFENQIVDLLQEMGESISFSIGNFLREETRKQTEKALRESEECLRLALEGSSDGLCDWDIPSGKLKLSPHFTAMLGYPPGELRLDIDALFELIHAEDQSRARMVMFEQLSRQNGSFELELRMATRSGDYEWILFRAKVVARNLSGVPIRVSGVLSKITEKKRYEETLQFMSTHDPLTGVFNRAFFDAELSRMAQSRQFPVSIILADIDGLKLVNDGFGHTEGDRLIRQAAEALQLVFRGEDVVARIGGDEFAVILRNTDSLAAKEAIKRVRLCQREINEGNGDYSLSLSLGSGTAESSEQLPEAFKMADARMYYYKFRRKSQRSPGPVAEAV